MGTSHAGGSRRSCFLQRAEVQTQINLINTPTVTLCSSDSVTCTDLILFCFADSLSYISYIYGLVKLVLMWAKLALY